MYDDDPYPPATQDDLPESGRWLAIVFIVVVSGLAITVLGVLAAIAGIEAGQ